MGRATAACIRSRLRRLGAICAEGGVLGVLPGIVGSIQAMETIKLILGTGEPLVGRLLLFDGAGHALPGIEAAQEPRLPALRRASDDHETD